MHVRERVLQRQEVRLRGDDCCHVPSFRTPWTGSPPWLLPRSDALLLLQMGKLRLLLLEKVDENQRLSDKVWGSTGFSSPFPGQL